MVKVRATMAAYYNEINPFAVRVLRKNIAAGNLPAGDVDERSIKDVSSGDLRGYRQVHLFAGIGGMPLGLRLAGVPDDESIWTAGFPCQDISQAGQGAGLEGARSGLWYEVPRLLSGDRSVRPERLLLENVAALLGRGLGEVLASLASVGYDARWHCIPASHVGAPHQRDRVWIMAYSRSVEMGEGCFDQANGQPWGSQEPKYFGLGRGRALADTDSQRREECDYAAESEPARRAARRVGKGQQDGPRATTINSLGNGANGLSSWMAGLGLAPWGQGWDVCIPKVAVGQKNVTPALAALGNAVVPQCVAYAVKELWG